MNTKRRGIIAAHCAAHASLPAKWKIGRSIHPISPSSRNVFAMHAALGTAYLITMNNLVFTLFKWIFLVIGVGFLAGAIAANGVGALVLAIIGVPFFCTGAGIIGYEWWSAKKATSLRQNGQLIQADFQEVEINGALNVNGVHPFRIVAQWHDVANNELFIFKSANLWFDPSQFLKEPKIPVYVDPNKPSRYHMDISFLPRVRG